MKRSARFAVLPLLLAVMSAPAFAQETLPGAVDSAFASNPTIMARRKVRATADEVLEQAKAAGRPTLGATGSYNYQYSEAGRKYSLGGQSFPEDGDITRSSAGLEARQTLFAGGAIAAQKNQAKAGVAASSENLRAYEQQLILDVVTAYMDARRAEQALEIRRNNASNLKKQVQAARDRFNVGEVTKTDVAQAEARASAADASEAQAVADLEAARAAYQELVGRPAVQLAKPPPPPPCPATLEEALNAAAANNPQNRSARAAAEAAEAGIGVAKGSLYPKLGVVGSAGLQDTQSDSSYQDKNAGLTAQLTIPLYQGGLAASKTRSARLERDRARLEATATERMIAAKTTRAWHATIAARQAITATTARVDAARIALEGAEQELAVGTRITLDVLDQEQELLDAQLSLAGAEREAYVAVHQLLAAIGALTPQAISR